MPAAAHSSGTVLRTDPWERYEPTDDRPWNVARVVHLHARAGFAATWSEIQRDLAGGPRTAIDRLASGRSREDVPSDFEVVSELLAREAIARRNAPRLQARWVHRMLLGPDPLRERMALLWHGHFATSIEKVGDVAIMQRQNELFRRLALAPFGELLLGVLHDPAVLLYLDAPTNRREHPNENLARELMELFTLGAGNYSEGDVKESARALTGWTVTSKGAFRDDATRHDGGEKSILGRTGRWDGDALASILLENPATAKRLASRIARAFVAEELLGDAVLEALAERLRSSGLDVGQAVDAVLRSRLFFSEDNLRRLVRGPAELVVGAVRALERLDPAPSTLALAGWIGRLGQELFAPPSVFGWPEGRRWLHARSIVARAEFANALAHGTLYAEPQPLGVVGLARRHGRARDAQDVLDFLGELWLGSPELDAEALPPDATLDLGDTDAWASAAARAFASPRAQLC